ncbi:TonB-dependent receptor [Microbulbifer sp. CAU 1566]|uniref:TonB-dependent receptor n=1 Tax=Microbulbifer sp. CAU 1566 TaxID=2933269 RepID=UPI0020047808|nr:TonB-dependent receptor [Microbulbifer sp. CAU 1566]MCK7598977.1 TonB-dependent receptor [Microbulbifer sp. CAU 1566]
MAYKKQILAVAIAMAASSSLVAQEAEKEQQEDSSFAVEEVYVEGVRSADLNARAAERDKDNFSSIVTQDDAGNFSDQNVAELLQRMPGITLQKSEGEGKFVNLRGLGAGMVSVRMDGGAMANAGGGTNETLEDRAFSLDSLPSDVLQSIEVNKSLTPDMELDAIGGSINVRTLSALDRGKNSLKFRAQNYYQDQVEADSPKVTLQGTNLFLNDTIGVAYTGSWEKRKTRGFQTKHHADTLPQYVDLGSDQMLIPWEFTNYEENAERERIAGLLNLEYAPNDNSRYHLKLNHTSYSDNDIAMREYYRFNWANGDEDLAFIDKENQVFGGSSVDLQQQFFIQESEVTTDTVSLGGENRFGDGWEVDYEVVASRSENAKPDGRRVQFRLRELNAIGSYGDDFLNGQLISGPQLTELAETGSITTGAVSGPNGYQYGKVKQPNLNYDNLFLEDALRTDEVNQFSFNLRHDWDAGMVNYVKTGVKVNQRSRTNDKNRASIVPFDRAVAGCAGDLECVSLAGARLGDFTTYVPLNGSFDHAMITREDAERLINGTRAIGDNYDPEQQELDSTKLDYELSEDTAAAYLMAEVQVLPEATLIAGARYAYTDFSSTGYMALRNDRNEDTQGLESLDIALPLEETGNDYGLFLPALHYRHELSDNLLGRASIWTSFSRPDFGKSRAFFEVTDRVVFCNTDPDYTGEEVCSDDPNAIGASRGGDLAYQAEFFEMSADNTVRIGNPGLDPMRATNLDLSLSYYGESTFLEGALFYKDIQDFIVDANGVKLNIGSDLSFVLPTDQVTMFNIPGDTTLTNVNTYLNGESAKVYGLELSASHYFDGQWENHDIGRYLDNIFIQSNLTLQTSDGNVGDSVRVGSIQLPETADTAANLTLGWENDDFSVRFIANYTSEILKRIGGCTADDIAADNELGYAANCRAWADMYQDESLTFDVKATYRIADGIRAYFDAVNLSDNVDQQFFSGNADSGGHILYNVEAYGPSYQLGLTVDF